ncbi:hypothetical protein MVES1_000319 [Malassezia vespertilionis]|uniref:Uncharacterized protein n=1 Tax=Malassezia vespertilionis TaxID=2020962 RepID=A0A2N1JGZ8_9BASI|nr:uncharacterized protein MVES1_000319 [Malassezia vespertilionis]PKI85831.1 hypothetical protein MVES_000299 [Malassezia vespertilionis]WFD04994.1 hypothetical protein MVES1_000319 [Malassezia vespertilionis]
MVQRSIVGIVAALVAVVAGAQLPLQRRNPFNKFSQVVVFGDSLVDNGNGTFLLTNKTWPRDPAYFNGRFSDGLVWTEHLADMLGVPTVVDHAYGSATTNNSRSKGESGYYSNITVPDMWQQVRTYTRNHARLDASALYILSGGSNDMYFGASSGSPQTIAKLAVSSLNKTAQELYRHGARHFVFESLGIVAGTPSARLPGAGENTTLAMQRFAETFNSEMRRLVAHTRRGHATFVDMHKCQRMIIDDPHKYGFKNTTAACLRGAYKDERDAGIQRHLCAHPEEYLFFDIFHPTTHTHQLFARAAADALTKSYAA